MSELNLVEHTSSFYGPRTYYNAKVSDLTAAFAINFFTAGERLTQKAAGDKYVGIALDIDTVSAARLLYKALRNLDAHVLNIAGNGIYSLHTKGWTQESVDTHIFDILQLVNKHWPISKIVSGGQTGVDIAGIIAARALGIDAIATFPKGFVQRYDDGVDVKMCPNKIMKYIEQEVGRLTSRSVAGGQSESKRYLL